MAHFKKTFAVSLATGFGVGYLPLAPGSWGSLVMAILCWWLLELPLGWYLALAGAIFLIGIGTVPFADKHLFQLTKKKSDNSQIVIDEFIGMMITLLPLFYFEKSIWWLCLGFFLFRAFDALKFGLAKLADELKNQWGVMLDDLLAGVHAAVAMFIIMWLV